MQSIPHPLRWLVLVACMAANLALNHQWVATWRLARPATKTERGTTVRQMVTVRERILLASVPADAPVVAPPAVGWLPLDPLGAWRNALSKAVLHTGVALACVVRAVALPTAPAFARLLGAAVSPQAP